MKNVFIIILLSLTGCHSFNYTQAAGKSNTRAQGYFANILYTTKQMRETSETKAITYNAEQGYKSTEETDKLLDKLNDDRNALIQQNIEKTKDLIREHARNKWIGWALRRIIFWTSLIAGAGLLLTIIFANGLPSGFLWGPFSTIVKFIISIPQRLIRLFHRPEKELSGA